ncbi:abc superfamily atp binding cassette transporter, membrane protein [Ligilactobacillus hayakitensis DSM 18933 = JCM 14209]|uniref:Abc superfamily atp binding cassette transporter, membrane protein n=1 Tax=Ligilactobacillus hayakitensis DSM 18933 = JCM 14209 TaxID=1423755 RepID=A0A0R1WWT2_9LACO|nr:YfhO family protein [Ligilactobacillus hayakitensis]KRM20436.1 abc superfamily atp binding cassette transporter, membrane protein [Ligilactobacillus hayakitensis DSM 18933 = JCM 14209]
MKKSKILRGGIAFLLPIAILIVIFAMKGIHPFGNNSVITGDLKNQYLAITSYYKHNFFNIHKLLYSSSLAIGGNFFSVLTYYVIFPINILSLFFSTEQLPNFFLINILFNVGLTSLIMYHYLGHSVVVDKISKQLFGKNNQYWSTSIIVSTIYSLSSFYRAYWQSVMWFNVIAYLPLVLLGLEYLIFDKNKNPMYYWLPLLVILIGNYYIGAMILIFLAMMTVIYGFFKANKLQEYLKVNLKVLFYTGMTLLGSAFVMVPSWLSQKEVSQEKYQFSTDKIFVFRKIFGSLIDYNQPKGMEPILYTSLLTVIAIVAFFLSRKVILKLKLLFAGLIGFLFLSSWIKGLYMIWHVFTMPNGFYQRESYIIDFVLMVVAYYGINLLLQSKLLPVISYLFLNMMIVVYYKLGYLDSHVFKMDLAILFGIVAAIYLSKVSNKFRYMMALIVILEILYSYQNTLTMDTSAKYDSYVKYVSENKKVLQKLRNDNGYRISSTVQLNENDPLLFNYAGVSTYVSQQPTSLTDYLSLLGYYQKHSWIRWSNFNGGSTEGINRLLSLKYILVPNKALMQESWQYGSMPTKDNTPQLVDYKKINGTKNIEIYKNDNVLPIGFATKYDGGFINLKYDTGEDFFNNLNDIFEGGFGIKRMYQKVNLTKEKVKTQEVIYSMNVQEGNLYLYIPSNRWIMDELGNMDIIFNGKHITKAFGDNSTGENGIINLGKANNITENKLILKGNNIQNISPIVTVEKRKKLDELIKVPKVTNVIQNGNAISFNAKQIKNNMTVNLPYDEGWKVYVDGKKLKTYKSMGGFIGFDKGTGTKVVMKYTVSGLKQALFVSSISVIILIFMSLKGVKIKKYGKKE